MGFLKDKYDVEEKGLDPTKPHSKIGSDGRLLPIDVSPNLPTVNEAEMGSSTQEAIIKKAVSVQKQKAVTLKSEQKRENAVKQDSNDSDMPSEVHKELPVETKKNKPKQTRKRKTPTKKRTKVTKVASTRKKTSTRRKTKKEEI